MIRIARLRTTCIAVSISAGAAVMLTSCGSPITANRDWVGYGRFVIHSHGPNSQLASGDSVVLAGYLLDRKGNPLLNAPYQERCDVIFPGSGRLPAGSRAQAAAEATAAASDSVTGGVWSCLFILNAGDRVYVASGAGPFGEMNSSAAPPNGPAATITLTALDPRSIPLDGQGNIRVKISARLPSHG
jgi:hypothetical protein